MESLATTRGSSTPRSFCLAAASVGPGMPDAPLDLELARLHGSALFFSAPGGGPIVAALVAGGEDLPRSVRVDGPVDFRSMGLVPGDDARLCDSALTVSSGKAFLLVSIPGEGLKSPRPRTDRPEPKDRHGRARNPFATASPPPAFGCGSLFADRLNHARLELELSFAMDGAKAMHCGADGANALCEAVVGLVGLGPGLTPSGDDFLCGFLAATRRTNPEVVRELCDAISSSLGRTTDVGAFFLNCAADGLEPPCLTVAADAVADGDNPAAQASLVRLYSIGHSSGSDMAAGLASGFRSAPYKLQEEAI